MVGKSVVLWRIPSLVTDMNVQRIASYLHGGCSTNVQCSAVVSAGWAIDSTWSTCVSHDALDCMRGCMHRWFSLSRVAFERSSAQRACSSCTRWRTFRAGCRITGCATTGAGSGTSDGLGGSAPPSCWKQSWQTVCPHGSATTGDTTSRHTGQSLPTNTSSPQWLFAGRFRHVGQACIRAGKQ